MSTSACPVCTTAIPMEETPRLSEIVDCEGCTSELEVVSLSPVVLALAPEVEEDWGE